ncbi:hypothetical protein BCR44DRAFT_1228428 [Catenaria anguillulae PL171]|uniref:Uncharacterized protein n=1 Tax=Catenaria anguillulae PL171 TaxID=765915 RepID=A0A1Y2HDX2_9FUNG|nr:hypothetical protein BCR44DRAFT_1228428 [Catenaria anguillulae PL171]
MSFPSTAAMGLSHSSIIHPPPPSTSSTPSIAGLLGVDVSSPLSPTFSTMSSSSLASAGAASANMASAAATTSAAAPAIDSMAAAAATELPYVIAAGDVSVLDIPSLYTLGTKHNSTIPVCVPMWTEAPRQKLGRTPKVRTQVRKIATVMAYLFAKKCVAIGTPVRSLTQVSIQEFIAPFLEHLPDPDTSKGRSREATKEGYPIGTLFREWAEAEKTLVASVVMWKRMCRRLLIRCLDRSEEEEQKEELVHAHCSHVPECCLVSSSSVVVCLVSN